MTRVGVIADTHGLLRPEALAALRGCDAILHAGDIGKPEVLAQLGALAPLTAVRGNNDHGPWADAVPETAVVRFDGVAVYLLHDRTALHSAPAPRGTRVVVAGHSHQPLVEERAGVLHLNPGSAGPRRFRLLIAVAELAIDGGDVRARIVELAIG